LRGKVGVQASRVVPTEVVEKQGEWEEETRRAWKGGGELAEGQGRGKTP